MWGPTKDGVQPAHVNGYHREPAPFEPRLDLSINPLRGAQGRSGVDTSLHRRGQAAAAVGRSARTPAQDWPAPGLITEPAVAEDDHDEGTAFEPPRKKRRVGGLVAVLVLLALVVGGAWFAYTNGDALKQSLEAALPSQSQSDAASTVPAPPSDGTAAMAKPAVKDAAFASAKPLAASSLQGFPDSPAGVDQVLQAGYLWQVVRAEFPEWYEERVREAARMASEKRPDDAISKHLIDSLILLRRKNSAHAFAASLGKLQSVARRFRDSLDALNNHSSVACFSLISNGEGTKGMVTLFRDPTYGPALQASLAAVFEAIAEGRRSPTSNLPARRSDYDMLTRELMAIGWDEKDIGTFAESDELAKSPPERVCKMVREWFSAHLAVPDAAVQRRLLVESVKPVVAG